MFDFSLSELLLIVVVAVIFIGPKDMPVAVRAVAKILMQIRSIARDLKSAFDDLARESGLHDIHEEMEREMKMITGDDGKQYRAYPIPETPPKPHDHE